MDSAAGNSLWREFPKAGGSTPWQNVYGSIRTTPAGGAMKKVILA